MTQEHPITPPPDLIEDWIELAKPLPQRPPDPNELATLAARWGADQELEFCVSYVDNNVSGNKARALRALRRPKPPSLKEQALLALSHLEKGAEPQMDATEAAYTIRCALESLPE